MDRRIILKRCLKLYDGSADLTELDHDGFR
jgi:hypothetical protein